MKLMNLLIHSTLIFKLNILFKTYFVNVDNNNEQFLYLSHF